MTMLSRASGALRFSISTSVLLKPRPGTALGARPAWPLCVTLLVLALVLAGCVPSAPPTPPGEPPRTVLSGTPPPTSPTAAPVASPRPPVTPAVPRVTPPPEPPATPAPNGWQRLGLAGQDLRAVAADPANPRALYAGGALLSGSTDGGRTWQPLRAVRSLQGLLVVGGDLFVAASDGCARGTRAPALRSGDGGATWQEIGANLRSIAARPDGSALYAAGCPGILRSDDGGREWRTVAAATGREGFAVAVSPAQPDVIWAAFVSEGGGVLMQRSADSGRTWQRAEPAGELWAPAMLALHPRQAEILYLATRNGIWRTADAGGTWARAEQGLEATRRAEGAVTLYDVAALLPLADRVVLASASAGVYTSRWEEPSFARLPGALPLTRDLALQRGDPAALLAATADGVYRSPLR